MCAIHSDVAIVEVAHASDAGFWEFRRQLEYKAKRYGTGLILADRWYASSKLCSCCGRKHESLVKPTRVATLRDQLARWFGAESALRTAGAR